LGEKIDKDQAWVRRVIRRRTKMVQIKGAKRRAPLREVKRGQMAFSFRWINDDSKRC
jgi:hypothetical protein